MIVYLIKKGVYWIKKTIGINHEDENGFILKVRKPKNHKKLMNEYQTVYLP